MQNLLNIFLYVTVSIYALVFFTDLALAIATALKSSSEAKPPQIAKAEESETALSKSTELKPLHTTKLKESKAIFSTAIEHKNCLANPANKAFKRVTKAQMKAYIAKQNLKDTIELQMQIRLYKATKRNIYNALKMI